jgi:DNA repair exonuclease SbcCD nuclease subunit
MKIAILSDLHLGYAWGTERQEDSFRQAREALQKASSSDLILIAGDIFDSRIPKQEVLSKAMHLFSKLKFKESEVNLIEIKNRKKLPNIRNIEIPIVGIYGTHERRGRNMTNPVHLLEEAGFLVQLHKQVAVFDLDGEKVAIHGISGVPEILAKKVIFEEANLKPEKDALNILILHQSFKEFMYYDELHPALSMNDLPSGFDLIVNGHIHWSNKKKIGESIFLIPGSTITTQIRKTESQIPKEAFFFNTKTKTLSSEQLKSTRKVVYREIDCTNLNNLEIKEKILKELEKIGKNEKRPLVRIKLIGETKETGSNLNFSEILSQYKDDLILTIKNNLESKEQREQMKFVREILDKNLSIDEIGLEILDENARKCKLGINAIEIYDLLKNNQLEEVENILIDSEKKPLEKVSSKETSKRSFIKNKTKKEENIMGKSPEIIDNTESWKQNKLKEKVLQKTLF